MSNFTVSRVKLYIYIYRCTFKFGVQGRSAASDSGKGHKLFIVGCVGFEQSLPKFVNYMKVFYLRASALILFVCALYEGVLYKGIRPYSLLSRWLLPWRHLASTRSREIHAWVPGPGPGRLGPSLWIIKGFLYKSVCVNFEGNLVVFPLTLGSLP